VRGGHNAPASGPINARVPSVRSPRPKVDSRLRKAGMATREGLGPIRSGSLLTPLLPSLPARPAGRFSPGAFGPGRCVGSVGSTGCSGARGWRPRALLLARPVGRGTSVIAKTYCLSKTKMFSNRCPFELVPAKVPVALLPSRDTTTVPVCITFPALMRLMLRV
jgi:hypothetical protein